MPSSSRSLGRDDALVGQAGQRGPGRRQLYPSGSEELGGAAVALGEQPEQQVLGTQVAVARPLGLLAGQIQDPVAGSVKRPNTLSPLAPDPSMAALLQRPAYRTPARSSATKADRSASGSTPKMSSSGPAAPR